METEKKRNNQGEKKGKKDEPRRKGRVTSERRTIQKNRED